MYPVTRHTYLRNGRITWRKMTLVFVVYAGADGSVRVVDQVFCNRDQLELVVDTCADGEPGEYSGLLGWGFI